MYPLNNAGNRPGNFSIDMPSKMESFNIPVVKEEPIENYISTQIMKYPQGNSSTVAPSQQPMQHETGIFMFPIENPSNNPYKLQNNSSDQSSLYQKYPTHPYVDDQPFLALSNNDINELPLNEFNWLPSMDDGSLFNNEKEFGKKEDDFFAQLLDLGGYDYLEEFGNNYSSDNNIPAGATNTFTASDPTLPLQNTFLHDINNTGSPQYSPMQSNSPFNTFHCNSQAPIDNVHIDNEHDPLVSVTNGYFSPPNNEITKPSEDIVSTNDDLQELLGNLLGNDDILINNTFGQADVNIIPSTSPSNMIIPTTTPPGASIYDILTSNEVRQNEDTNHDDATMNHEDIFIPSSFDLPPATKKSKETGSSIPLSMEIVPSKIEKKIPPIHHFKPSLKSPPLAKDLPSPPPPPKTSSRSRNHSNSSSGSNKSSPVAHSKGIGGGGLFGQDEDAIIEKLLSSQSCNGGAAKPITRDKLIIMAVEDFNSLLDEANLTEIEIAFMKEWRRRGKNKMAAQIARKRKREELSELEDDMGTLHHKRDQLQQNVVDLTNLIASFKRRVEMAETKVYHHYSMMHGSLVSKDTHSIHVTDDGKTMLIPRISSQVLIL
jgi:flagellar capping protein FliD